MVFGDKAVTTPSAAAWRTKNGTAGNEDMGNLFWAAVWNLTQSAEGRSKGGTF